MADLLDIAPSTACEVVKIDGLRITVHGLNGNAIASIVARFPEIGAAFSGNGAQTGRQLIARLGNAIGPIIAAGCGHLADEKYEQHAAQLLAEQQFQLLKAIIGLTFPNGIAAFFVAVTSALQQGADANEKPIKVRLRKSQSASHPSSETASRPTMQ